MGLVTKWVGLLMVAAGLACGALTARQTIPSQNTVYGMVVLTAFGLLVYLVSYAFRRRPVHDPEWY